MGKNSGKSLDGVILKNIKIKTTPSKSNTEVVVPTSWEELASPQKSTTNEIVTELETIEKLLNNGVTSTVRQLDFTSKGEQINSTYSVNIENLAPTSKISPTGSQEADFYDSTSQTGECEQIKTYLTTQPSPKYISSISNECPAESYNSSVIKTMPNNSSGILDSLLNESHLDEVTFKNKETSTPRAALKDLPEFPTPTQNAKAISSTESKRSKKHIKGSPSFSVKNRSKLAPKRKCFSLEEVTIVKKKGRFDSVFKSTIPSMPCIHALCLTPEERERTCAKSENICQEKDCKANACG